MKFWQLVSTTIALSISVNVNAATYSIDSMNITGGGFVAFDEAGQAFVNPSAGGTFTSFTTIGTDTNLVGGYLGETTTGFLSSVWFDTPVQFYTAPLNMGGIIAPTGSIQGGAIPSGTLNDIAGTITMDLSSYFAYWGGADLHQGTGKNDGLTSSVATGGWDSNTGLYSLTWVSNIDPSVCGPLGATCYAEYTFEGYAAASVVPVPAAIWLFGSGLIGLISLTRRKKA